MYLNCKICNRVTNHKEVRTQAINSHFPYGSVEANLFYICPHCDTGVSATRTNIKGKITTNLRQ